MPVRRSKGRRRGGRSTPYSQRNTRRRNVSPICLSSDDEGDIEEISSPNISTNRSASSSSSNIRTSTLCNDMEEISNVSESPAQVNDDKKETPQDDYPDSYDSDDFEDIYAIDYKAQKFKVMNKVHSAFQNIEAQVQNKVVQVDHSDKEANLSDSENQQCDSSISSIMDESSSSLKINFDDIQLKSNEKPRINRKTRQALASLHSFSTPLISKKSNNDSLQEDVFLIEGDVQHTSSFRILWGTKYLKLLMNKRDKFLNLYQQLAEVHKVSVSEIILSFNNECVSPDSRPSDIGFTIADVLEGGILSNDQENKGDHTLANTIELKFQSSDRKGTVTLTICKFDKFSLILEKYAKAKNTQSGKLKFRIDGETIDFGETPSFYDLENGDCIDVIETRYLSL